MLRDCCFKRFLSKGVTAVEELQHEQSHSYSQSCPKLMSL